MRYSSSNKLLVETLEELRSIIDSEPEEVSVRPLKHDISFVDIVFYYDGYAWMLSYERSYIDGIQFYSPIEANRVEKQDVVVKKWVIVK